eukprot:1181000-Prorocentrum_minimum.AAC.1
MAGTSTCYARTLPMLRYQDKGEDTGRASPAAQPSVSPNIPHKVATLKPYDPKTRTAWVVNP